MLFNPSGIHFSPAESESDVIAAWNEECRSHSFNTYDPVVYEGAIGGLYTGGDFEADCPALMEAIQSNENVLSENAADPHHDDLMGSVVSRNGVGAPFYS